MNGAIHSLIKSVIDKAAQSKKLLHPKDTINQESETERDFRREHGDFFV